MITRRRFTTAALAATACAYSIRALAASSPFHVGVISDEISQDFDHACSVIANDFGLHFVELREIGGKNLQVLSDADITQALKTLAKYNLTVTDIASPLFKVNWPGAPTPSTAPKKTCTEPTRSASKSKPKS